MSYPAIFFIKKSRGFRGPLDDFDTSAFTLSTAVLYSRQIGQPMFRIRRSADDNHCDVLPDTSALINGTYFVGLNSPVNNFETASAATTLGEFVASSGYNNPDSLAAASDAFVRTAYDPSGNARDAEQATAASQPQIVSAGALVAGGIDFDSTDFLRMASNSPSCTAETLFSVCNITSQNSIHFGAIVTGSTGAPDYQARIEQNSGLPEWTVSGFTNGVKALRGGSTMPITQNSQRLLTYIRSVSDNHIGVFENGTSRGSQTHSDGTVTPRYQIGGGTDGLIGKVQAVVIYQTYQPANRAAIEAKLAEIYGITLA